MASVEVQLPPELEAAQDARTAIRRQLSDTMPAPALYDVLTIVSELVTNAVRHGEDGPIRMLVSVGTDGRIHGEVENHGVGRVAMREIDVATRTGLGLHMVDAIADHWHATTGPDTTVVKFELRSP